MQDSESLGQGAAARYHPRPSLTDIGAHGEHFVAVQRAVAGQFTIEHLLGRGGMGLVYLAREVRLDRLVAIKLLPPELYDDPVVRERFLRESRIAAQLSHPNIVPIFRVDEVEGFVFFVMQYINGPTLAARVRHEGALPPADVARIVRDVAWALAYAHARGVVHRDIKPENILLDRETGRALVTDFGIAQRLAASDLMGDPDSSGVVVGSAHFMSPEQAAGAPVDGRSDLYSLGMVAWYALAGQLAFEGRAREVLEKQRRDSPPPLAAMNPAVPPDLAHVVHRALAKAPRDRYPTAEMFAEAVTLSIAPHLVIDVPLRLWLSSGDELRYVLAAVLGFGGLSLAHDGILNGLAAYVVTVVVGYVVLELAEVRRLLAAGYSLEALRAALRSNTERLEVGEKRFSLANARGRAGGQLADVVGARRRAVARAFGFGACLVAATSTVLIGIREHRVSIEGIGMFAIGLAGLAAGMRRAAERRRLALLRARIWQGRAGDVLAHIVSWGISRRKSSALDATRLLAESAEQFLRRESDRLLVALPQATQRDLQKLPDIVTALDQRANLLRRRIGDLDRSLAILEDGREADSTPANARRKAAITEVRAQRDAAGAQLQDVISQLEEIRLELLSLQRNAGALAPLLRRMRVAEVETDGSMDVGRQHDAPLG